MNNPPTMSLGRKVMNARLDRGLTIANLATLTGLSRVALNSIEKDRATNPRVSTIRLISDALDVPVGYLANGAEMYRPFGPYQAMKSITKE
jgi:transcriptional regulator with XRE-family HTH domain